MAISKGGREGGRKAGIRSVGKQQWRVIRVAIQAMRKPRHNEGSQRLKGTGEGEAIQREPGKACNILVNKGQKEGILEDPHFSN